MATESAVFCRRVASVGAVTSEGARGVARRLGPVLGLLLLVASLVVAADLFGTREALFGSATPPPKPSAFSRVASETPAQRAKRTRLRSQPWWQEVDTFGGVGKTRTSEIEISDDATQWRLRWSCSGGRFVVRAAGQKKPLVNSTCAAKKSSEFTAKPDGALQVEAEGRWRVTVEQQVDVPLVEPPLPAMSAPGTAKVASGSFYRMDQTGRGRLTFYRLASGRYALRLTDVYFTPNVDLEIRLHPLRAPKTTRQYLSAPSKIAAPLDITAGSMNFVLPAGVDPLRYRSVVIWCPLITSAYAGATLNQQQ